MSPIFGRRDKNEKADRGNDELAAEVERLRSLPLATLAAEVMVRGFGPEGAGGADTGVGLGNLTSVFCGDAKLKIGMFAQTRAWEKLTADERLCRELEKLIGEALQQLEHASLIQTRVLSTGSGAESWAATRLGREALQRNDVERIIAGGNSY